MKSGNVLFGFPRVSSGIWAAQQSLSIERTRAHSKESDWLGGEGEHVVFKVVGAFLP